MTLLSEPQLTRQLSKNFVPVTGSTISQRLSLIANTASTQPPGDWVVELGTNDVKALVTDCG